MRSRRKNMLVPAMLTVLVVGSGCASRGYVRTQVGESADVLQASVHDNTEQIEMSSQDLNQLETETLEANRVQNDEIANTQNMIETTGNELATEVEQVRTMATAARNTATGADERSRNLSRMFEDRGRLAVADTREIYFGFSSSTIAPEHAEALQAVGDTLRSDPNTILLLEGRTDSTGDPVFNTNLAQGRVNAAMNYLVLELGVPIHRIYGFSYGEARPDYDNDVREERGKNRSVKLVVLGPGTETSIAALPE